jgi:hypothetical protein
MSARETTRRGSAGPGPRPFVGGPLAGGGRWYRPSWGADAKDPQGLGDSRPQAQGCSERSTEACSAREEVLDRRLSGCLDQLAEHRRLGRAAVVAPRPLVQVALEPLVRDGVVSARQPQRGKQSQVVERGYCVLLGSTRPIGRVPGRRSTAASVPALLPPSLLSHGDSASTEKGQFPVSTESESLVVQTTRPRGVVLWCLAFKVGKCLVDRGQNRVSRWAWGQLFKRRSALLQMHSAEVAFAQIPRKADSRLYPVAESAQPRMAAGFLSVDGILAQF